MPSLTFNGSHGFYPDWGSTSFRDNLLDFRDRGRYFRDREFRCIGREHMRITEAVPVLAEFAEQGVFHVSKRILQVFAQDSPTSRP